MTRQTIERVYAPRRSRTSPSSAESAGSASRVPRIARLLALAIRFEALLRSKEIRDCAELALLGHVSRARISQIMNLNLLAPDIQEDILFLPCTERGRDPIRLAMLQPIALEPRWSKQRLLWHTLRSRTYPGAQAADHAKQPRNCLEVVFRPR